MNPICNLFSALFPKLEGDPSQRELVREIDASTRFGVLGAIKASIFWMLVASLLGLISSVKLHTPDYLSEYDFLTYGKVYPAFWNALVYGWLANAGLACMAWIIARLSGRVSGNGLVFAISNGAWNLAVILGIFGIFKGDQTPYRMLEFPVYVAPLLWVSFMGMGVWLLLAYRARAFRSSFASQWYALAAVFSFVWIYTIVQVMVFCLPAQGVYQEVVATWFRSNLFGLVIAPMAFSVVYYMIPKVLGQTIVGYRQSSLAFWTWIGFTSFSGLASLVNGPYPAWVASMGVIGAFGLFLPTTIFSIQFLSSLFSSFSKIWETITARYIAYSVVAFLVSMLLFILSSLREMQDVIQYSQFETGARFLFLAGFCGMAFTGATYFILPRLLNKELPSTGLADVQFWVQGLGIFAVTLALITGGYAHGSLLNGSDANTIDILRATKSYLFISTIGVVIFSCGSFMYLVTFGWMLLTGRTEKETSTELIEPATELEYNAQ